MRAPAKYDLVLHFYEDSWPDGVTEMRLFGYSCVSRPYILVEEEPPMAGEWSGMQPYYIIDLRDFNSFSSPLPLRTLTSEYEDSIRSDLVENHPRYYPFTIYRGEIRTVQGIYLAQCTNQLYDVFFEALSIHSALATTELIPTVDKLALEPHSDYRESRR